MAVNKKKPKIGIFCSSDPLSRSKKETDYSYLKSKGFEVVEQDQVRKRTGHTAGSIQERVASLNALLQDDSIDILMAYWGGANTNQILPYLDYDMFKKFPKPMIGFSDTSALLLAVNKLSGVRTYMGPSGITFDKPQPFDYSFDYFYKTIVKPDSKVLIEDSPIWADDLYFLRKDSDHRIIKDNSGRKVFKDGKAHGVICASNLQTLLVLAGTKFFPDLKDKILFLEEAEDESPSMIHRFFTHLSQVIDLNTLRGICIGRFAEQNNFKPENSEEMIYEDVFGSLDLPIIYNLDFGHTDPLFTIPMGATARIDTKADLLEFIL